MLRRETKRKARRVLSIVLIAIIAVGVAIALFFANKTISPFISFGQNSKELIRPLGETTTLDDLKKRLADKNIIFESIKAATESGEFVGKVKEGPTVLFSQNQDAKWQVASLALILQRTTVNNKKPVLVDLTTNRPIVKF